MDFSSRNGKGGSWLPVMALLVAAMLAALGTASAPASALSGGFAWGEGEAGQLGNAAAGNADAPVHVRWSERFTAVSAGQAHSLALLRDGSVRAWGEDQEGQLGDGNSGPEAGSSFPVRVTELSGAA